MIGWPCHLQMQWCNINMCFLLLFMWIKKHTHTYILVLRLLLQKSCKLTKSPFPFCFRYCYIQVHRDIKVSGGALAYCAAQTKTKLFFMPYINNLYAFVICPPACLFVRNRSFHYLCATFTYHPLIQPYVVMLK